MFILKGGISFHCVVFLFQRSPLADIMNSLKSYHSMKSEQSRTFAASIRDEVISNLRELLRKESAEARKILNDGRKNDTDMKILLEKIETVNRIYTTSFCDVFLGKKEVCNYKF